MSNVKDNTKNFENIKKVIVIFENIFTGIAVVALILMFLCAAHLLLNIFNNHALNFLDPMYNAIKEFVTFAFGSNIRQNLNGIDGREVLFILLCMVVAYFFTQLRVAFKSIQRDVKKKVVEEKERVEIEFNKELKDEAINKILEQSSYLVCVRLKVRSLIKAGIGLQVPTEDELENIKIESISKFYDMMKTNNKLSFSKDKDILIMYSNDFSSIDEILNLIWENLYELKAILKERKLGIRVQIMVDSYDNSKDYLSVYKNLTPLFDLNNMNEIVCYGNFITRYELVEDAQYYPAVKGKYDINESSDNVIWSLVKKS